MASPVPVQQENGANHERVDLEAVDGPHLASAARSIHSIEPIEIDDSVGQ